MEDLRSILESHYNKSSSKKTTEINVQNSKQDDHYQFSEIPDLFFDEILVDYKLNRIEIMVLMYLYRQVWCKPNLQREHGITNVISHDKIISKLSIDRNSFFNALTKLEGVGFIETIRSGQYFVRKFFTQDNDRKHGQNYDNFNV